MGSLITAALWDTMKSLSNPPLHLPAELHLRANAESWKLGPPPRHCWARRLRPHTPPCPGRKQRKHTSLFKYLQWEQLTERSPAVLLGSMGIPQMTRS
ncbi:hypothetical protein AAFF_G00042800 [Aldrovandia affinis]|uniref:Uncharacterized protein n=1 Tax=Aldrovandia affinis TaxID=143900 RepID=A0AAD7WFH4_9TELE|nr:hypothetical protein AAFF_G00042800 [Aldrovandia affinis]